MGKVRLVGASLEGYVDHCVSAADYFGGTCYINRLECHEIEESDLARIEPDRYYLRTPNDLGLPVEWSFS